MSKIHYYYYYYYYYYFQNKLTFSLKIIHHEVIRWDSWSLESLAWNNGIGNRGSSCGSWGSVSEIPVIYTGIEIVRATPREIWRVWRQNTLLKVIMPKILWVVQQVTGARSDWRWWWWSQVCYHSCQDFLGWQGLVLTLICQHGLGEELHLTCELLKVWLGRSFRDNKFCLAS